VTQLRSVSFLSHASRTRGSPQSQWGAGPGMVHPDSPSLGGSQCGSRRCLWLYAACGPWYGVCRCKGTRMQRTATASPVQAPAQCVGAGTVHRHRGKHSAICSQGRYTGAWLPTGQDTVQYCMFMRTQIDVRTLTPGSPGVPPACAPWLFPMPTSPACGPCLCPLPVCPGPWYALGVPSPGHGANPRSARAGAPRAARTQRQRGSPEQRGHRKATRRTVLFVSTTIRRCYNAL